MEPTSSSANFSNVSADNKVVNFCINNLVCNSSSELIIFLNLQIYVHYGTQQYLETISSSSDLSDPSANSSFLDGVV
jgi:hypothetical protein